MFTKAQVEKTILEVTSQMNLLPGRAHRAELVRVIRELTEYAQQERQYRNLSWVTQEWLSTVSGGDFLP